MKLSKFTLFIIILFIVFSFVGCNSTKSKLPASMPKDFDFIFNYGVGAKNQLDTITDQYTKDMVSEASVTTDLKLSDEEMNDIYLEMLKINIMDYPENFSPKSNMSQTPYHTYSIKIFINGMRKSIDWKDESVSEAEEAVQLREVFQKIKTIITNKEEYKKLPQPKAGYL